MNIFRSELKINFLLIILTAVISTGCENKSVETTSSSSNNKTDFSDFSRLVSEYIKTVLAVDYDFSPDLNGAVDYLYKIKSSDPDMYKRLTDNIGQLTHELKPRIAIASANGSLTQFHVMEDVFSDNLFRFIAACRLLRFSDTDDVKTKQEFHKLGKAILFESPLSKKVPLFIVYSNRTGSCLAVHLADPSNGCRKNAVTDTIAAAIIQAVDVYGPPVRVSNAATICNMASGLSTGKGSMHYRRAISEFYKSVYHSTNLSQLTKAFTDDLSTVLYERRIMRAPITNQEKPYVFDVAGAYGD